MTNPAKKRKPVTYELVYSTILKKKFNKLDTLHTFLHSNKYNGVIYIYKKQGRDREALRTDEVYYKPEEYRNQ